MKEVRMFMFESCPHCQKALKIISALIGSYKRYGNVPFAMTDEKKDPAEADRYDYYYVPTFYVDGVKVHEGSVKEQDIRRVFEIAMEED